jgi:hypothetical protein
MSARRTLGATMKVAEVRFVLFGHEALERGLRHPEAPFDSPVGLAQGKEASGRRCGACGHRE